MQKENNDDESISPSLDKSLDFKSNENEIQDLDSENKSSQIESLSIKKENFKETSLDFKSKTKNNFEDYIEAYKSLNINKISLFWLFIILSIIFFILAFTSFNKRFLITIPTYGGTLNEGVLGTARFINPVLAYTQVDKDLSYLIYSGLTKKDINGEIILNLAKSIESSEDGLKYIVKIKENAKFQDGKNLTADDIIFTLNIIQNKNINSPLAIDFEGVTVNKISDYELEFNLKKPFYYFKEKLSFGILPKHIWENINTETFSVSEQNLNPIGSGPYKVKNVIRDSFVVKKFELSSFSEYALGRPYINNINIFIYDDEKKIIDAFNSGKINRINNLSIKNVNDVENENIFISTSTLPNLYSLSFNPNKNILLSDKNIRLALSYAVPKKEIVDQILKNNANISNSNMPFKNWNDNKDYFNEELSKEYLNKYFQMKNSNNKQTSKQKTLNNIKTSTSSDTALKIDTNLNATSASSFINKSAGVINISTVNTEELKAVANIIKENWEELGFNVNIKIYELSDFSNNVIKNRDFEILLFGSIVERDIDLFAYWSSTQRNYPGLNITGYASKNLDKELDNLRNNQNDTQREISLENINAELNSEMPAIPIYTKLFTYYTKDDYKEANLIPKYINSEEYRFTNVKDWYIYTEKIWSKAYIKNLIEKLNNIIH